MYGSEFYLLMAGPILAFVFLVVIIVAWVFYLLNLQNLLKQISPENRSVEPGYVWLLFIPIFNLIYPFILYPRISESIFAEYSERGLDTSSDFSKSIGLFLAISAVIGFVPLVPYMDIISMFSQLILLIIYWVKMAGYKKELKNSPKSKGGFSNSVDILD